MCLQEKSFKIFWNLGIFSEVPAADILNYTSLAVSFEDNTCIKYRRSIYMTWDNILCMNLLISHESINIVVLIILSEIFIFVYLASFGGIFGLCLGGSVISLMEIAHFLLTRTIGKFLLHHIQRKQNRKRKTAPKVFTITNGHQLGLVHTIDAKVGVNGYNAF